MNEVAGRESESSQVCDRIEAALAAEGAGVALGVLVEALETGDDARALLDALLLWARHDLGLPLIDVGPLSEMAEPARTQYEERYIEAIRRVGGWLLAKGDVVAAWPYFRTIGEREPVAAALAELDLSQGDSRLGAIIDLALYQGAAPARGFELILEHHGTCSAISAFEQLPPEEGLRGRCAALLTRTLHAQLAGNLRAELARAVQTRVDESTPIPALIAGRDWLFEDDGYHIDISHLASVVRMSPLLRERPDQMRALELCEYGRRLAPRLRYDDAPPFERTYEDHAAYLDVLVGRDIPGGLDHFRAKLNRAVAEEDARESVTASAQVLVRLLNELGRVDEAIDVAAAHLWDIPEGFLSCPGVAALCDRGDRLETLARLSRERGRAVTFAAAILGQRSRGGGESRGAER